MKIAILHHQYNAFEKTSYLIDHCSQNWIHQGHSVIHINGVDSNFPDADLLILHVNLTIVPQEYVQASVRYPLIINRRVIDISKPVFSQIIVRADDDYQGPVIVKTSNNYGGIPEKRIKKMGGIMLGKFLQQHSWQLSWRRVDWLKEYPVFESIQKVPRGIWQNEHLIVEKFMPERDSKGNYCVREWIFLGGQQLHFMNISREPVIKSTNTYQRVQLTVDEVPTELQTIRSRLGFDYGKFDYGIHNNKPVLYDINKTPGAPHNLNDRSGAIGKIRLLSQGLESYIHEGSGL